MEIPGRIIDRYSDLSEKTAQYTEQLREAENLLKQMLGEHEIGFTGDKIITWKTCSQERLDLKTLKADHPILYAKYVNQSSHRRFSIKKVI